MGKRFNISESDRNHISKMYGLIKENAISNDLSFLKLAFPDATETTFSSLPALKREFPNSNEHVFYIVNPDGSRRYFRYDAGAQSDKSRGSWKIENGIVVHGNDTDLNSQSNIDTTTNWITSFQQQLKDAGYGSLLGTSGPNGDGVDGKLGAKTATAAYSLLKAKGIIS